MLGARRNAAERERAAIAAREQDLALAYRRVFAGADGEAVLNDIFDFAGLGHDLQPRRQDGAIDTAGVLRNDGKRALALHIGQRVLQSPSAVARRAASLLPPLPDDEGE